MNKRPFWLATVLVLALAFSGEAQQLKKAPLIGYLSRSSASGNLPRIQALREGLRELGHIEGESFLIEYRYADGSSERLSSLATELVRRNPDVIVAPGIEPVAAAKKATQTIPIVMVNAPDPVSAGFVSNLARPGGNVTGLTNIAPDLSGKRLELLKETVPNTRRIAILWNPTVPQRSNEVKETEAVARQFDVQLLSTEARSSSDLDRAFSALTAGRVQAAIILGDAVFNANRSRILELATTNRIPAMFTEEEYVLAGGLMFYGPSTNDLSRRAAIYVDKILKGAKAADLPVEQPTKFELLINLKTAKQIGLTIPPAVLARADKVIK
jgi:putative ABC transport system substrate-binding protein